MKVISVNVALPQNILINDAYVATGIFKRPVKGSVRVMRLNLDGDAQADLQVHGGPDKAVYVYPSEHYEFWRRELAHDLFGWGTFGENITAEGLTESTISIGDQIALGTAVFQVTQPRLPCFKLAAKFQRNDVIKRFLDSRKTGFYVRVLHEGEIEAGETIQLLERDAKGVSIREIVDLYLQKKAAPSEIERVLSVQALSQAWREHFNKLLPGRGLF